VNDPRILILDEPLGKLDSLTRITMQAEIASLWQRSGFTTLLVTHDVEEAVFLANRVIVFSDRPARIKADIAVDRPLSPAPGRSQIGGAAPEHSGVTGIGRNMVSAIRKELPMDGCFDHLRQGKLAGCRISVRAALHDRDASFPFENFNQLSEAGLLALTVPTALGGSGAGALDAARIINILGKADPSTALVLSMHYIQYLVMARSPHWPGRLARKLARETVEGVALINALRVEPDLGSPSRGGLAGDDRAQDRDGMAAQWSQDLFDRSADPEMVRGVGQNRRTEHPRRPVPGSRGVAGDAHCRDLGPSRAARQRQP